jgi:hypothetical protein
MNMESNRSKSDGESRFRPEPAISWVVEQEGICLLQKSTADAFFLSYPKAAVWDLLFQGYTLEHTIQLIGKMFNLDNEDATEQVQNWILDWKESGLIRNES